MEDIEGEEDDAPADETDEDTGAEDGGEGGLSVTEDCCQNR